ncbi:MAG: FAD-binding oxidoreductase [Myxococcota bacterium]|nr:FAD-binding oxidoreductase [Myxococcota bacterium]
MVDTPGCIPTRLSGWGNFPVQECHVYRPGDLEEIRLILENAVQSDFISRGQGRSYGDAALNQDGGVLLPDCLDRIRHWDGESGELECEAATTLSQILEYIVPRGFFLPITPGTRHISVGGAIAADVHGKNHHRDGTISRQLLSFRLLTASGSVLTCSREENSELFWATLGGMGLTGVIIDATLKLRRVETSYMNTRTERCRDLDDALERMAAGDQSYDYAVTWIDCLARGASMGRAVLLRANPARLEDLPAKLRAKPLSAASPRKLALPFSLPSGLLNSFTMRAFNAALYRAFSDGPGIVGYDRYFYPLDRIGNWNRIYGQRGVVQYQLVLPLARAREGLVEILERTVADHCGSFLAVLKSTGPANQAPLSFPMEGITLALDFPNRGPSLMKTIRKLDEIVLRHEGRLYLAKDSTLRPEDFAAMYPRLGEFQAIKARYDPEKRFSSSLARRLRIVDSG